MSERQEVRDEVRRAALDLLESDAAFDDDVFTPPGAIGLGLPPEGEDPGSSSDREPRQPKNPSAAGAIALQEPSH